MDDLNVFGLRDEQLPRCTYLTLYFQNSSDSTPVPCAGTLRVIYADSSGNWVGREALTPPSS